MNQRSDNITRFRVAPDGKLSAEPDYTRSAAHPDGHFTLSRKRTTTCDFRTNV
ncbi:hypothetical protein ACVXG7_31645 [Enterobacter hormaechei]